MNFQLSKFQGFIMLSLIAHGLLFLIPEKKIDHTKKIQKKLRYISMLPPQVKYKRPAKKIISKQQVVNSEVKKDQKVKVDTRFLGKTTQSFARQTIAKKVGSFKQSALGSSQKKKITNLGKKQKKKIKLTDLGLGNLLLSQASAEISPHQNLEKLGAKNGFKKVSGLAQNNDFIEDIPLGNTTYLNTVEFKYFSFYERIRKRLELFWGETIQQKAQQIFRQGRRLPAGQNLITSLIIELNDQGIIKNITINGSSGFNELDSAAVESFNQAGPFPNPPTGMIKNGKAHVEWGFVVNS